MNRKLLSLQSKKKSPRKVPRLEGLWIALTKNAPPKLRTVGSGGIDLLAEHGYKSQS